MKKPLFERVEMILQLGGLHRGNLPRLLYTAPRRFQAETLARSNFNSFASALLIFWQGRPGGIVGGHPQTRPLASFRAALRWLRAGRGRSQGRGGRSVSARRKP